jgi:hypothetical protein
MDEREKQERPASHEVEEAKRTSDAKVAKIEDLDVPAEQAANVSGGRRQPPPDPD